MEVFMIKLTGFLNFGKKDEAEALKRELREANDRLLKIQEAWIGKFSSAGLTKAESVEEGIKSLPFQLNDSVKESLERWVQGLYLHFTAGEPEFFSRPLTAGTALVVLKEKWAGESKYSVALIISSTECIKYPL